MATYKSLPEVDSLDFLEYNTNFIVEYNNDLYRLHNEQIRKKISIIICLDGLSDNQGGEYGILTYTDPLGNQTDYKIYPTRRTYSGNYYYAYDFKWELKSGEVSTMLRTWANAMSIPSIEVYFTIDDRVQDIKGESHSWFLDSYGGLSFSIGQGYIRLTTNSVSGGTNEPA